MVQKKYSRLILDATYIRRVLSWNRTFGCSYFVRVLNKTWTSSYKWFRVLNKTWTISAHACHMRNDNNKSSFCWPVTRLTKWLCSQSVDRFLPTRLGFLLYSSYATSSFWIFFNSTVFTRKEDFSKWKKHLWRSLFLLKMTTRFCFLLQRAILDIANGFANGNFSCKWGCIKNKTRTIYTRSSRLM